MNKPKRMLAAALAAGALVASIIPLHDAVADSSPPSDVLNYTVARNAQRIGGGLSVRVVVRLTCAPGTSVPRQEITISQAYPDGRIARGTALIGNPGFECDGSLQRVPVTVDADELAFIEGVALADSRLVGCLSAFGPCAFFTELKTIDIADPVVPLVEVRPLGAVAVEGNIGSTVADVAVRLSEPSSAPVTIDWTTFDDPSNPLIAHPGEDFAAASGTVTFAPGETEQTISITIYGDTVDEPPLLYGEWGLIEFSNPSSNAVLDTQTFFGFGLIIIIDDD